MSRSNDLSHVLQRIKDDWPSLLNSNCNPLDIALLLLDNSSVGLAHRYPDFIDLKSQFSHTLQRAVNDNYQAFNDSIGSFGLALASLSESQTTLSHIREQLESVQKIVNSHVGLMNELNHKNMQYGEAIDILDAISELKQNSEIIDTFIKAKDFNHAQAIISKSFISAEKYGLWQIPALASTQQVLQLQVQKLFELIIANMNGILYLKIDESDPNNSYEEEMSSELFSMSSTDIEDISHVINKPVEQFLSELKEDSDIVPGEDTHRFEALKNDLYVLKKINKMEEALAALSAESGLQYRELVYTTIEEIRKKYPEQIELSQQPSASSKQADLSDFDSYVINGASAHILQEFFSSLFRKCIYVLQNHIAIYRMAKLAKIDYDITPIWEGLEKQIGDIIYGYIADETYNKDTERDDTIKNIRSPFATSVKGDIFDNSDPLFQFAKLKIGDNGALKNSVEFKGALDDIFKGKQKQRIIGTDDTVYIDSNANQAKKNILVPPNVFNMGVIVDNFLFFVGSASVLLPQQKKEDPLNFFDHFMNIVFFKHLESTLIFQFDKVLSKNGNTGASEYKSSAAFKRFFKASLDALDTSLYFREPYVNLMIKCLNKMVEKYSSALSELVTEDYLKQTKTKLLPHWLNDAALVKTSTDLMINQDKRQSKNLINKEISSLLQLENKTVNMINEENLFDTTKYGALSKLLTSLVYTLTWLPDLKREVKPLQLSANSENPEGLRLTKLRESWHIQNYNDKATKTTTRRSDNTSNNNSNAGSESTEDVMVEMVNNDSNLNDQDTHLALFGQSINEFTAIVQKLNDMAWRVKLLLRYDIRIRAILTIAQLYGKEIWMPSYESGEIDSSILRFNKFIVEINKLLCQAITNNGTVNTSTIVLADNDNDNKLQVFIGLPDLIDHLLISESKRIIKMNSNGVYSIFVSIRVLKQMLRNVMDDPEDVNFNKSIGYFEMFKSTDKGILERIKNEKKGTSNGSSNGKGKNNGLYDLDQYKNLVRLVFSESMAKDMVKRQNNSYSASKRYDDTVKKLDLEFKN